MDAPTSSAGVRPGTDQELCARLRAGDETAFADLVRAWSPAMLRLARQFVSTSQSAEDAVQDAWVGMLRGLDRFQGRASLRTWTFLDPDQPGQVPGRPRESNDGRSACGRGRRDRPTDG
jgi:hypothetical protein